MTEYATPLPATSENVASGALWTAAVFPFLVAFYFVAQAGPYDYVLGLFGIIVVFTLCASVLLIPLLGVPLALATARILRTVPSVAAHLLGQFVAGTVAGSIVVAAFIGLTGSTFGDDNLAPGAGLALVTGLASAIGWSMALRRYRRPPRPDPYGTADEDVD